MMKDYKRQIQSHMQFLITWATFRRFILQILYTNLIYGFTKYLDDKPPNLQNYSIVNDVKINQGFRHSC